jgi:hypothetical protein
LKDGALYKMTEGKEKHACFSASFYFKKRPFLKMGKKQDRGKNMHVFSPYVFSPIIFMGAPFMARGPHFMFFPLILLYIFIPKNSPPIY